MDESQLARWIFFAGAAYLIISMMCLIVLLEKISIITKLLEKIHKHQVQSTPIDPTLKALNDIYEAGRR